MNMLKVVARKVVTGVDTLAPVNQRWFAYDDSTYDADCDQDGFFSTSPVGHGATEGEALTDFAELVL